MFTFNDVATEPASKHMHEDATKLQQDLDLLHEWVVKWQLRFNVTKNWNVLLCASQELYHQLSSTLNWMEPTY